MTLIIDAIENAGSRRGNSGQSTRSYTIQGADDVTGSPMTEEEFSLWLESQIGSEDIPETLAGLGIGDVSYNEREAIHGLYDVTVTWNVPLNQFEYRFNFQAKGGHFVQSLSTVSAHSQSASVYNTGDAEAFATALGTIGAPNFGGAINVVPAQDGPPKAEGFDIQPPSETFTLVYHTTDDVITREYQLQVNDLCGHVNSEDFFDLPAGSTMLVRAVGQRVRNIWTVEFGFGYVKNLTEADDPLEIGNYITVPKKDGLDLLWVYREHEVEDSYGIVRPEPKVAFVERVWPRADLNSLNLPNQND